MRSFLYSLAAATTLLVGSLATPSTAEAQRFRRGYYGGGYYGGYYRPYYGGYYRPYGSYYRPNYYGNYSYPVYRSYYRYGYGNPGYYNRGYGAPGYYYSAPGVRIGAGIGGVRIY